MVDVGDVLAGKYRVERVLGRGGMGYVVSAFHAQLGQRVAVKFMIPELCERVEPVARFMREAQAAVRIRNEHVARVLDVGKLDDGAPYMVMEYLDGHDLAEELDRRLQLPIYAAVDYVIQACEAIAEAHALGIIHRDLKPANLFLTRRMDGSPFVKVLDFGISKALLDEEGRPASSLTATQALIGSPQYMSPEQVRKPKTVDGRSDVWALGIILYELLTGRQPFSGDTSMSVLAAIVSDPTPPLKPDRPDLPAELEAVIFKCLEKKPEARYQSVAEFAQALEPFAPATAVPSIQRISGTLRTPTPIRFSSDLPTIDAPDGSAPPLSLPEADTVHATPDSLPAQPTPGALAESRSESSTAAEWGKSTKSGDEGGKTRRNAIVLGTAVFVVVLLVGLGVTSFKRLTPTVESARPADPPLAASSTAPVETPSNVLPVLNVPTSVAADKADAEANKLEASHTSKPGPRETHPKTEAPVKAPAPSSAPAPVGSTPSPMHPLEGRH